MCGVAGFVNLSDAIKGPACLASMMRAIQHRGPDENGQEIFAHAGLGHQRLSIIDLESGQQPMKSSDGRFTIVYNGEVYNFQELREELIKLGVHFRTRSDTEVIINGFQQWGETVFGRLNGMFGLAIYDHLQEQLFLARDRFGIKPLFYCHIGEQLYFASELKAFKEIPVRLSLDLEAVSIYLSQMYIPQPWTIFEQVRRLRAGHSLRFDRRGLHETCYYDMDFSQKDASITQSQAQDQLVALLSRSVERHLIADVPLGMFLSGGFDSCAVLAMARKHGAELDSFTLSFREKKYDESDTASSWANFLGSRHHRIIMNEADFLQRLPRRQGHSLEPVAPWINVGKQLLCEAARAHKLKTVLSGAGGDELFCGYPTLNASIVAHYYGKLPNLVRDRIVKPLTNALPAGQGGLPLSFMVKSFTNAIDKNPLRTFFNFKSVIGRDRYANLLTARWNERLTEVDPFVAFAQYAKRIEDWPLIDQLQYLDFKNFLEGGILFLGDNASMSQSLEERVPFLENSLLEFALRLPLERKFQLRMVKPLLRSSMESYLHSVGGEHLIKNCRKQGFELPGNQWARTGALRSYLREILSESRLEKIGVFLPPAIGQLLDEHEQGVHNHERTLQAVLGLQTFFEMNEFALA